MHKANLIENYGSHWKVDKDCGQWAVRQVPGTLGDPGNPLRLPDMISALECAREHIVSDDEKLLEEARVKLQEAAGTPLKRIACALHPRGRRSLWRDLCQCRIQVSTGRLSRARYDSFLIHIPRFPLPDEIRVPDLLPVGTEIWVVKADWPETQGIRTESFRIEEAHFSPVTAVEGQAWGVSYVAISSEAGRTGFRHEDVTEYGTIDLRIVGWSGHLTKEGAEAEAARATERLRSQGDADSKTFAMPGEHDDVPPRTDEDKAAELKMWLIVRTDLDMPRPKGLGQSGHAFAAALWKARLLRPAVADAYMATAGQAKIVVGVKNADAMRRAYEDCEAAGLPAVIVRDAGRTVFPEPTLTFAAVGPCRRGELPKFVQRLQFLKA